MFVPCVDMSDDYSILKKTHGYGVRPSTVMQCNEPMCNTRRIVKKLMSSTYEPIERTELMKMIREVSIASAVLQLLLFVLVMTTGPFGFYTRHNGLMYISNNLCNSRFLSVCFMLCTLPTWFILACSVSKVVRWKRTCILLFISIPFPMGIGVVLFDWCSNPSIHYAYVIVFVISVASVHLVVAGSANHFVFLQRYVAILVGTAIFGILFISLAMSEMGPGIHRNIAVISEYFMALGFILLNGLSVDRIYEHIQL